MTPPMQRVAPAPSVVRAALNRIAAEHKMLPRDLLARRRDARTVAARREAMLAVWREGGGRYSVASIAKAFGRHHSTLLQHLRAVGEVTGALR